MSRSAVHFECPSLFTSSPSPQTEQDRRTPTPHRPTPLNLKKTKAIYPSRPAVNSPELSTLPVVEKPSKVKKVANDPFEVAEVESGHRYPHWKGGKVDIRPGELIPQGVLGISSGRPSIQAGKREPDQIQYESVLHNVLLTPTYLGSPVSSPSPSAFASKSYLKHRTLVVRDADPFQSAAKISSSSKWVGKNPEENWDDKVGRSIRDMREREEREMDRFRWAASQSPEISHAYCRSPGLREWSLGAMSATRKHEKGSKHLKGWNGRRGEDSKVKWRHKFGKYAIALAILCPAALTVGLCTSILTRSSSSKPAVSSASSSSTTTTSPLSTSTAFPAVASASTSSQSLTTCLNLFSSSASIFPLAYPCSDCTPILTSTNNDFTTPLIDGNSTGVGAALQFCTLMDLYRASGNGSGLASEGWAKNASPCQGWSGISCDSDGRITELQMQYPNVPVQLPTTLENLVTLRTLHIIGNSIIPSGAFPLALLSSATLETIDIENSALTGPLSSVDFIQAKGLTTLNLVNNQELGTTLPNLSGNTQLLTLVLTGQGLTNFSADALPGSLTYLDLSFNSLSGIVPPFTQLTSLRTLYLQSNAFTRAPSSLPSSLTTLSLTSNPTLEG
ncbi:MAG: hypothetical protein TREMPRED_005302, partial [Tremellales sp. Tagirdzhanova-0007]